MKKRECILNVEVDEDVMHLILKSLKNKTDLINGIKILKCDIQGNESISKNDDVSNKWPAFSNCTRICRNCMARCLYRKEQYQDRTKHHVNGWTDMSDRNAIQKMFDSIKI